MGDGWRGVPDAETGSRAYYYYPETDADAEARGAGLYDLVHGAGDWWDWRLVLLLL